MLNSNTNNITQSINNQYILNDIATKISNLFFIEKNKIGKYLVASPGQKSTPIQIKNPNLELEIKNHVSGTSSIGSYTSNSQNLCKYACLDFDLNKKAKEDFLQNQNLELFQTEKEKLGKIALLEYKSYRKRKIQCVLEDSVGGFHLWFFFSNPQPLVNVYDFVRSLGSSANDQFPKQRELPKHASGNFVRLPGQYHSTTLNNKKSRSKFMIEEKWLTIDSIPAWTNFLYYCENNRLDLEKISWKKLPKTKGERNTKSKFLSPSNESDLITSAIKVLKSTPNLFDSYDEYKILLLAMKDANNRHPQFTYHDFDEIAKQSSNYNEKENRKQWTTAKPREITFKTLIWKANKENPNLFKRELNSHIVEEIIEEHTAKFIKPVEPQNENILNIRELNKKLSSLANNKILIFSSATGTGKSRLLAKQAVETAKSGEKVTLITGSLDTVESLTDYVNKELKAKRLDIKVSANTSHNKTESNSQGKIHNIAITTYYYLGRMGETKYTYHIADKLTTDRVIYADEIQTLLQRSTINIPLATRYKKNKTTYSRLKKCPKQCSNCIIGYLRQSKDNFGNQPFYNRFAAGSKDLHTTKSKPIIKNLPSDIWDINTYKNYEGMFFRDIEQNLSFNVSKYIDFSEKDDDIEFSHYIDSIIDHLAFPQLSMVSPTSENEPIRPCDADENTKYPHQICNIPQLKGIDILPILQMLQAKRIVMASATVPEDLIKTLDLVTKEKDWKYEVYNNNEIPFTFNATFLTCQKKLSPYHQALLMKSLDSNNLFVTAKKSETIELDSRARSNGVNEKEIYKKGIYEDSPVLRDRYKQESTLTKNTITYLRANLLTGVNRPDKNVMVIDCSGFHPQIVCTQRRLEDRKREIVKKLQILVTQAIGRLLRTKERRISGETIKDNRPLVFLLHGLTFELKIERQLFHKLTIVEETFLTSKKPYISCALAIKEALKENFIPNYKELELRDKRKKTTQKAINQGLNKLSPKNRQHVNQYEYKKQRQKIKLEKRLEKLFQEAENFQGTYREFYRNRNLNRLKLTKKQLEKFRNIVNKN